MAEFDRVFRVCAVCGRVLDFDESTGGWQHPLGAVLDGEDDHPAVPALPTEIHTVGFCDFCQAPDPPLELPARAFEYPAVPGRGSRGNWGCCVQCAALLETNQWNKLVQRVADGHLRRFGEELDPEVRALVPVLFRRLRANITGGVRPSTVPRPGS